jgi:hypothetical protein
LNSFTDSSVLGIPDTPFHSGPHSVLSVYSQDQLPVILFERRYLGRIVKGCRIPSWQVKTGWPSKKLDPIFLLFSVHSHALSSMGLKDLPHRW